LPAGSVMEPSGTGVGGFVTVESAGVTVESVGVTEESAGVTVDSSGTGVGVTLVVSPGTTICSSGAADLLESSPQALNKRSAAAESVKLVLVLKFILTSFV